MIISYLEADKTIRLRWRDSNRIRQEKTIEDFAPYFFIDKEERRPNDYKTVLTVNGKDVKITGFFRYKEGPWSTIDGKELTKVFYDNPKDTYKARRKFKRTWEGDVPILRRYCVDELKTVPEYDLRKWYWDMEWLPDEHEYSGAITCIAAYDNYEKKNTLWAWLPNNTEYSDKEFIESQNYNDCVWLYCDEKTMLQSFMNTIEAKDPDMMIAWYGMQADIPKLIERLAANGLDPRKLSPYKEVKNVGYKHIGNLEYSAIEQPIRGRITLNLDLAFERQWMDSQRGTLPSNSLEYCGSVSVGEGKKKESKFTDRNEFFMRAWLEDTENYFEYCLQDAELMYKIDEEMGLSEGVLALQRLVKAPFEACFFVSHMGSIYFMRNAWWKAPTGKKGPKVEYDGAMIYNPLDEGTNGLHLGVAAFDFASLYPSCILARNISWETKSLEPTEFAVNLSTPRDFSETKQANWLFYKTDKLGLLPNAIHTMKPLRKEYKVKMLEALKAGNKKEYVKWNSMQMAVKRLLASLYGVVALQGFGWEDVDLAASITASAREAIREAAFKVEGLE
jgi:DNA polymerase elongation subunit (family B)